MELNREFRKAREAAFDEIQQAMIEKIKEKALWSQEFVKGKTDGLVLPEHIQLSETFRWPASISYAASDLKEGKKDLKEIFSRVSSRYEGKPAQVIGVADDFTRSPESKTDGRKSAFEDMFKLLDVAERDFDLTYKPLTRESMEYWHKKHPIEPQHLEYAFRENQRHFMKESISEMRQFLTDLESGKPAPKPPKP